MKKIIISILLLIPLSTFSQLTGYWQTDVGGCYQIRQNGNEIWWAGESSNIQRPSNVFHGTIAGNMLTGQWCDLPSSANQGCEQTLALRIENNNTLVKTASSAPYNGSTWTRQSGMAGCGGGQCSYNNLAANWKAIKGDWSSTGFSIDQKGNQLTLIGSDQSEVTATCSGNILTVDGNSWGQNLTGTVSNNGNRIDFSNGSHWIKE